MSSELVELIPPLTVGVVFTSLGVLKFYALAKGIEGGPGKPWLTRLRGTCPKSNCRLPGLNWWLPLLFLAIGISGILGFVWNLFP